jgi:hypothetical protein
VRWSGTEFSFRVTSSRPEGLVDPEIRRVSLQLETGEVLTLENVVVSSAGQHVNPCRKIYFLEGAASQGFVGVDEVDREKIDTLVFDCQRLNGWVHPSTFEGIEDNEWFRDDHAFYVLCASSEGVSLEIWLPKKDKFYRSVATAGVKVFCQSPGLDGLNREVEFVRALLSIIFGSTVKFENFRCGLVDEDLKGLHKYFSQHHANYKSDLDAEFPAVRLVTPENIKDFCVGVASWLSWCRQHPSATTILNRILERSRVFDSQRLRNAVGFVEEVTSDVLSVETSSHDLEDAAHRAAEVFPEELRDRVRSALARVGSPSHRDVLEALVIDAWPPFAPSLRKDIVRDARTAFRFRGKFSHGNRAMSSAEEFEAVLRSLDALETIILRYVFSRLGVSVGRLDIVNYHPLCLYDRIHKDHFNVDTRQS